MGFMDHGPGGTAETTGTMRLQTLVSTEVRRRMAWIDNLGMSK
jgi:hypothetical protein